MTTADCCVTPSSTLHCPRFGLRPQVTPMIASMDALFAAGVSYGDQYPAFFAELRAAFPELG